MASPPRKRVRRTIIISSDEEDSAADSQISTASLNVTTRSLNLKKDPRGEEVLSRKLVKPSSKPPKKAAASKSKAATTNGNTITKNANIYSFFTNATQSNSQSSLPKKSPQDEKIPPDVEDLIEDDSLDENGLNSSTPVPRQGDAVSKSVSGTTSSVTHVEPSTVAKSKQFAIKVEELPSRRDIATDLDVDYRPWADLYPPESSEELVVHKKKVADVHRWLDNVMKGRERKVCYLEWC